MGPPWLLFLSPSSGMTPKSPQGPAAPGETLNPDLCSGLLVRMLEITTIFTNVQQVVMPVLTQ